MPNIKPPDYLGQAELVTWYQTVDLLLSAKVDLQPCDADVLGIYCTMSHAVKFCTDEEQKAETLALLTRVRGELLIPIH